MKKQTIIAANWKMNCDINSTENLIKDILNINLSNACNAILCVPFTNLYLCQKLLKNSPFSLGAQNCHWQDDGAFTGEISGTMLKSVGTEYVIIGHSERRNIFCETDEMINKRILGALKAGLKVILCVGENEFENKNNLTCEKISTQLKLDLLNIEKKFLENIFIAYEPIWAIGTGNACPAQKAEDICKYIRASFCEFYGKNISQNLKILYGGSLNSKNAKEILSQKNIDGGLIGGASLKSDEFKKILELVG